MMIGGGTTTTHGKMRRYAVDIDFKTGSSRILEDNFLNGGGSPKRREGTIDDFVSFLSQCISSHKQQQQQPQQHNHKHHDSSARNTNNACTSPSSSSSSSSSSSPITTTATTFSICQVDFVWNGSGDNTVLINLRLSSSCYPFGKKDMDIFQLFDVTNTGTINDRLGLLFAANPEYLMFQSIPDFVVSVQQQQQQPLKTITTTTTTTSSNIINNNNNNNNTSTSSLVGLNSLKCLAVTQTTATLPLLSFVGQLIQHSTNLERLILSCLRKDTQRMQFLSDDDEDVMLYTPIAKGLSSSNRKSSSLRHLQLEDLDLSDQAMAMIITSAACVSSTILSSSSSSSSLSTIYLKRNRPGPYTMHAIESILEGPSSLYEVSLINDQSMPGGGGGERQQPLNLSPIAGVLLRNTTNLSSLTLSGNHLTDAGMEQFIQSLSCTNTTLKVLRMDNCSVVTTNAVPSPPVSSSSSPHLSLVAAGPTTSTTTNVGPCFGSTTSIRTFDALANGISTMKSLQILDISGSIMTENNFSLFAFGLRYNTSLRELYARNLQIVFAINSSVACSAVSKNTINNSRLFGTIFEALKYNTTLKILDLSHNDMSSSSSTNEKNDSSLMISVLGDSLSANRTLQSLSLEDCHLSANNLQFLGRYQLPRFRGLRELVIDKNELDRLALQDFVYGIRNNHILTKLVVGQHNHHQWTTTATSSTTCGQPQQQRRRRTNEYEEILFHLKLNRRWRRSLKHPSFPIKLWPKLLESEWDVSIVYVLLREKILVT